MNGFLLLASQNFFSDPLNFFAEPMVLAALSISVFITALAYMLGEFLSMPSIKGFAKLELRELGVTAVIIVIAMMLAIPGGVFDTVASGFALPLDLSSLPQNGFNGTAMNHEAFVCQEWLNSHKDESGNLPVLLKNPVTGAPYYSKGNYAFARADHFIGCRFGFLDTMLFFTGYVSNIDLAGNHKANGYMMPRLLGIYLKYMLVEFTTGFLSTVSFSYTFPMITTPPVGMTISNFAPLNFMSIVNEINTLFVDTVGMVIGAFTAQKMLLNFIEFSVISFFLPFGLLLRAFPFSRKTGSTVVAFAFAAYFIFPISVLINSQMYGMIENPPCEAGLYPENSVCTEDSQCCSGDCRNGKCAGLMTDMNEYTSGFTIGKKAIDDPELNESFDQAILQEAQYEIDYRESLQANQVQYIGSPSKAKSQYDARIMEQERAEQLQEDRWGQGGNFFTASPWKASEWVLRVLQWAISDTAKIVMLALMFVVMEIVLSLTLMKDFALLIGGEPRLLGISKLV